MMDILPSGPVNFMGMTVDAGILVLGVVALLGIVFAYYIYSVVSGRKTEDVTAVPKL
jgi:hypothetical protein